MNCINTIRVKGTALGELKFIYQNANEKFYRFTIATCRRSGIYDYIPVVISERHFASVEKLSGDEFEILGQVRTYTERDNQAKKNHVKVFLFVKQIKKCDENCADINEVELKGFICKPPIFRISPKGRRVTEIILAVNRENKKSDYIPCICWGREAEYVSGMEVGECVEALGRFQSREYIKRHEDKTEKKTAYEISFSNVILSDSDNFGGVGNE